MWAYSRGITVLKKYFGSKTKNKKNEFQIVKGHFKNLRTDLLYKNEFPLLKNYYILEVVTLYYIILCIKTINKCYKN